MMCTISLLKTWRISFVKAFYFRADSIWLITCQKYNTMPCRSRFPGVHFTQTHNQYCILYGGNYKIMSLISILIHPTTPTPSPCSVYTFILIFCFCHLKLWAKFSEGKIFFWSKFIVNLNFALVTYIFVYVSVCSYVLLYVCAYGYMWLYMSVCVYV